MFMSIIWNTEDGVEVKHLNETNWFDASVFLHENNIKFTDLKCVEVEDLRNNDSYTIISKFEDYFLS